jgi:hypothetical protein
MSEQPVVLRFPVAQEGAFVNACLVETAAGVVAVDSLLTVSESRAMRHALERLGKPLQAVLLTHSGVTFDGVRFTVIDLGPSESPHDSPGSSEPRTSARRPFAAGAGEGRRHRADEGLRAGRRASDPDGAQHPPGRSATRPAERRHHTVELGLLR